MLKLILGLKGSGKTKTLIEMVNEASHTSNGNVVCIEKGQKLIYDIKYKARLIEADAFGIGDAQALFGFLAGIAASNHDLSDVFIDSALKICNNDLTAFTEFVEKAKKLAERSNFNLIMTSSIALEDAPEELKQYV
ncbi:MAG: hypothetical protein IJU41_08880 [Clostridia bacterium]|nr:hypothetical protein [Clostridia bacterium]